MSRYGKRIERQKTGGKSRPVIWGHFLKGQSRGIEPEFFCVCAGCFRLHLFSSQTGQDVCGVTTFETCDFDLTLAFFAANWRLTPAPGVPNLSPPICDEDFFKQGGGAEIGAFDSVFPPNPDRANSVSMLSSSSPAQTRHCPLNLRT